MQDGRNVSLEQLVAEASDELLSEPDYSKQLDITERITAYGAAMTPSKCVEVCNAIGARMDKKKKSENTIYLLLHLMDFLLKNVTPQMGHVMSRPEFQKHIVKLAKGRTVKGRAQMLLVCKVQEWAYLFQNHRGFQETYIALQKQGHEFPAPTPELMAEQSRLNERRLERQGERARRAAAPNDPMSRLKENLRLLQDNVSLVQEMLAAVDAPRENVRDNELVAPLLESIAGQRAKIGELLGTVEDEETLLLLLGLNDDINKAMFSYQELLQGRRVPRDEPSSPVSPPHHAPVLATAVVHPPVSSSFSPPSLAPPPGPPPAYTPSSPDPVPEDPFAALAKLRHAKDASRAAARVSGPTPSLAPGSSLDLLFSVPAPQTNAPPVLPPPAYSPSPVGLFAAPPPSTLFSPPPLSNPYAVPANAVPPSSVNNNNNPFLDNNSFGGAYNSNNSGVAPVYNPSLFTTTNPGNSVFNTSGSVPNSNNGSVGYNGNPPSSLYPPSPPPNYAQPPGTYGTHY